MAARYDIMLDIYTRRILIEARTMAEMARTQLYPAISRYLTEAAQAVKALGDIGKASRSQQDKLDCLISLLDSMDEDIVLLTDKIGRADGMKKDHEACAAFCAGEILPAMNDLRGGHRPPGVDGRQPVLAHPHLQRNPLQRPGEKSGIW